MFIPTTSIYGDLGDGFLLFYTHITSFVSRWVCKDHQPIISVRLHMGLRVLVEQSTDETENLSSILGSLNFIGQPKVPLTSCWWIRHGSEDQISRERGPLEFGQCQY